MKRMKQHGHRDESQLIFLSFFERKKIRFYLFAVQAVRTWQRWRRKQNAYTHTLKQKSKLKSKMSSTNQSAEQASTHTHGYFYVLTGLVGGPWSVQIIISIFSRHWWCCMCYFTPHFVVLFNNVFGLGYHTLKSLSLPHWRERRFTNCQINNYQKEKMCKNSSFEKCIHLHTTKMRSICL